MKILVTGFEPFGTDKINPSWEAVKQLPENIAGNEVIKKEFPVVFDSCYELIGKLINAEHPDAILHIGQAGGRTCITPEFVAINQRNGIDNAGIEYHDAKIFDEAPDAYFTTLPVKRMTDRLHASGIPAKISYTAGTYVCNNLMYSSLHYINRNKLNIACGFVHIPFSAEQAVIHGSGGYPFMDIRTSAQAVKECIAAIFEK